MVNFDNYEVGRNRISLKPQESLESVDDPLTSSIQSQSTEIYENDDLTDLNINNKNVINDDDNILSDTSSISFEIYDDKISREKIISQLNEFNKDENENENENIGDFLLKYYKYRELTDLSNGVGELIKGIDTDLIELVNENYLSFINLGKSIDGSLDLIHDIKIDLTDYLKKLKLSNKSIDEDLNKIKKLQDSRLNLIKMKSLLKKVIKLNEMIECFEKLCNKFDKFDNRFDLLKELVGLYFGINKMFLKILNQINEDNFQDLINNGVFSNLSKKMNGLKLEFKSLLSNYLLHLKESNQTNDEIFEVFKLYQLLNLTDDFKKSL